MTGTSFHEGQGFRAIQYRPDIPNCRDVARFLGDEEWEHACCYETSHAEGTWWVDSDAGEAECGDWLILYPSGMVEIVSDEFYTGPRS